VYKTSPQLEQLAQDLQQYKQQQEQQQYLTIFVPDAADDERDSCQHAVDNPWHASALDNAWDACVAAADEPILANISYWH
jgi:hypothetical protein